MSSTGSSKEGAGNFLLVVSGVIQFAPYLRGWQEYKDHLRRIVREQPGWVDVYPSQSQRRGEMQGWARLRDREDADLAYGVYSDSKGMLVHVWETSFNSQGFRLVKCNCSLHFPGLVAGAHSSTSSGIDIRKVDQLSRPDPVSRVPYVAVQPAYSYARYPQAQAYAAVPVHPVHVTQAPIYSTSTNGIPVNVRGGAVLTEARGIFIRNLSYKATPDDLFNLLVTVGQPVHFNLIRDSRTGLFKGAATATFSSTEQAKYAVMCLDRLEHMGMMLSVRLDTETTAVGRSEPMVVNGSAPYRH
ncbi:hypothetical protein IQ07DRAFT_23494 [Pyrenochaeta sp. DS3sAY3a]|nr:hypothetical protein IQ07DRAFT_23494 [Pyrenochaeta sp. DS3sAY3a]